MQEKKVIRKTTNTYEAAFYLCHGAYLADVRERKIAVNIAKKKEYRMEWKMILNSVPFHAVLDWKHGQANVNARRYAAARRTLKKLIRKHLACIRELDQEVN